MEFRLLGPVEMWHDGRRIELGHARQRCVLAVLLLEAGQVVPASTLIDRVWGHEPPDSALSGLYAYIARLRQALTPAGVNVLKRGRGYVLDVDPETVDVHRFRRLLAAAAWDEALALWRGTPLADVASPWLAQTREALLRQRLSAQIERNEAYLRSGRHAELLSELPDLVAAHPTDERPVAQLMLALYRSGRTSAALDEYRHARQRLADQLGIEPGPRLRELHQRMLRSDPNPALPESGGKRRAPAGLPHDVAGFVGRRAELARLDALVPAANTRRTVVISAVDGTAGVGKTALAVHWAHRVRSRFPDGNLYADLRGFGPGSPAAPEQVLDGFLAALDVAPSRIPADLEAKAALYRTLLEELSMLVVLDNAADARQVRPLLPGSAGCLVVVTSRSMLTWLADRERAHRVSLDVLPAAEAITLLAQFIGEDRVAADRAAAHRLAQLCARLPVALCVAGERAAAHPDRTLQDLVAELADRQRRLDALDADGDPETAVRAVFSWSYTALSPAAARLFRQMGLHPGPDLSLAAAASLAGASRDEVAPLLTELARAHLISEPAAGRYTFHDLLRAFARELAANAGERDCVERALDHYLHSAHGAALALQPNRTPIALPPPEPGVTPERPDDHEQALAWFTAERPVLVAAIEHAAALGLDAHAWRLAWTLVDFLDRRGHWHEWAATARIALAAAERLADPPTQALAHRILARACNRLVRYDDAHLHFKHSLQLYESAGDPGGQARTHLDLGEVFGRQGRDAEALHHSRRAFDLYRTIGHRIGQAHALNNMSWYHAQLGDHWQALAAGRRALAIHRQLDDRDGRAAVWDTLGYAHHHLGDHRQAVACYRRALGLYRELGYRYWEAATLTRLGDTHHTTGDLDTARRVWQDALDILTDLDHPNADQVRGKLAALG